VHNQDVWVLKMSKGLGKKQSELLELLKGSDDKYDGVSIVKISTAVEQTGMHQSAVSRGIKSLEERQIVKLITLRTVSKDSIALPVAGSSKQETLSNINQVGKAVKAFTWFDSDLKKENWKVLSETFRSKDEHEQVLLAIKRLKQVNFVFEKVYKELVVFKSGNSYESYRIHPNSSSKKPLGSLDGLAIPLRYIVLESKIKLHILKRVLKELERVGYVNLVYSGDVLGRSDLQDIIGVY